MPPKVASREEGPPNFSFGSVWLIGASDLNQLSSIALNALRSADAVIHDAGVSSDVLELVPPPCYREAALPAKAIERAVKLAQDGWRIVCLVEGDPLTPNHAIECAAKLSGHGISFRVIPIADEPSIGGAPIALLMLHRPRLDLRTDPQAVETEAAMVSVSVICQTSEEALGNGSKLSALRGTAPLGFSMSGLAG